MSIRCSNFPGDRKERYYVEDRRSFDEFHDRDAITTIARPVRTSMTTTSSVANTHIDWQETSDAHVFRLELPGMKKHEVKVEVEDNLLCISGEMRAEKEEGSQMWRRVERSSGKFYRRIGLPDGADVDHVKADMNNGVLTVTVPKHHFKKTAARTVQISGY